MSLDFAGNFVNINRGNEEYKSYCHIPNAAMSIYSAIEKHIDPMVNIVSFVSEVHADLVMPCGKYDDKAFFDSFSTEELDSYYKYKSYRAVKTANNGEVPFIVKSGRKQSGTFVTVRMGSIISDRVPVIILEYGDEKAARLLAVQYAIISIADEVDKTIQCFSTKFSVTIEFSQDDTANSKKNISLVYNGMISLSESFYDETSDTVKRSYYLHSLKILHREILARYAAKEKV